MIGWIFFISSVIGAGYFDAGAPVTVKDFEVNEQVIKRLDELEKRVEKLSEEEPVGKHKKPPEEKQGGSADSEREQILKALEEIKKKLESKAPQEKQQHEPVDSAKPEK